MRLRENSEKSQCEYTGKSNPRFRQNLKFTNNTYNEAFTHTVLYSRRRINKEEKAKNVAAVWGTEFIQFLAALATEFCTGRFEEQDEFILLFKSSWCNSSFSSNHPDAIHPFLQIILVQFILFFKSSWCNSSFSSNRPRAKQIARHGIE